MDMDVPVVEDSFRQVEVSAVRLEVFERQHGRLLHHVPQVSGERELSLSPAQAGFDEEDLAPYGRPCQSRHHSGVFVALILVARVLGGPEVLRDVLGLQLMGFRKVSAGDFERDFPHHLADFLLQFAHAALAGIVFDDVLDGPFREFHVLLLQSRGVHFLRDEVAARYLDLLFRDVSAHLDQLHAVEQRSRDGGQVVCRGDEHHFREVIVDVNVVVVERAVLFRVEHFEHGRRRVAVAVAAQLVDFVEDDDRVRRFRLDQAFDDASRHGSDIRLAVSAYLRLVVYASERHAHILAFQRGRDGSSERGFSHARRAVEADDGRFEVAFQLQHGEVFKDALLHLFQSVVVLVEHLLGVRYVDIVG